MSIDEQASDPLLDRAISEVRNESVDPAAVSAAVDRVWASLSADAPGPLSEHAGAMRTCADFQALIPSWREHRLRAPARYWSKIISTSAQLAAKRWAGAGSPYRSPSGGPRVRSGSGPSPRP